MSSLDAVRGGRTSATEGVQLGTPAPAPSASRSNAGLLPAPTDIGSDDDGLTLLYKLNAEQGAAQTSAQRGTVRASGDLRDAVRKLAMAARAKEADKAAKHKGRGGIFGGLKSLVKDLVSNVVHLRPGRLVTDVGKDLKKTLDVTDPDFLRNLASVGKVYGKCVAAAVAIAGSVVTCGALAAACCVAVCVCVAASIAMEDAKVGDRLHLSEKLKMGIGFGLTAVTIVASLGVGGAATVGTKAAEGAQKAAEVAAKAGQAAAKGVSIGVQAANASITTAQTVVEAKYEQTLATLHADSTEANQRVRQSVAQVEQNVQLYADITQSYENAKSVLVDAIDIQDQSRSMIMGGLRA